MSGNTVSLGDYLFTRFKQQDVLSIFGLPGDFNLSLLDHVYNVEGMKWVGNTNELNSGYAADGYSRVKGLAALITTFGVGELSALAAVGGSYAEHVGMVHIVGVPSISAQQEQLLLHHTLGNGDFAAFERMSANISHSVHHVTGVEDAAQSIDAAIQAAYINQRPVYLTIPANLSEIELCAKRLATPLDMSLPDNDSDAEDEVIERVSKMLQAAQKPILLVDACASRHSCIEETAELAKLVNFPVFLTPMGKGAFDEQNKRYGGVYVGSLSSPEVSEVVDNADLVLSVGGLMSDFNTGSFSYGYTTKNIIELHSDYTKIKSSSYAKVGMKQLFPKLLKSLAPIAQDLMAKEFINVIPPKQVATPVIPGSTIYQKWLWTRLGSFFRKGDIVVTETGTSAFGIVQTKFATGVTGISQVLWGSIGFSVGAAMGAVMASEELDLSRRVILFVGDGSLQLTVTEISTMVRWGLKPYLFFLNNDGYTIERLIHGENASYNDIHPWKNSRILDVFNAKEGEHEAIQVSTTDELDNLLSDPAFNKNDKIRSIEVFLPKMDAPENLVKQAQFSSSVNSA
ncbi:pyruvate decarboxylase [Nadsonia fulvescens var. elongata DSM 6958]|uniref:Pyruvate decarboxylase n=1 Tax=Nadsonia fulvescens var. elongata DSM 6958 TaxID=857566 RepID=A0A1E3PK22_9ASCO|nr:pyruvate decarboxylase [Nadsonia fulvescens var. elongata DSM 6958]